MDVIETSTKTCIKCNILKPLKTFSAYTDSKRRGSRRKICNSCKYKREKVNFTEERKQRKRDYAKKYHSKNGHIARIKSYQRFDRLKNRKSISMTEGRQLIETGICYYCGNNDLKELGLDRIDNSKGHELANVLVCCGKCNNILGDLPQKAKEILKTGLIEIHKKGILESWIIPTKRKKL